jgi:hypothetical protein
MFDINKYFEELRFNDKHHLELGNIRLTISQQEEIIDLFNKNIAFEKLAYWIIENKISSFLDADISKGDKITILHKFGYSANMLD